MLLKIYKKKKKKIAGIRFFPGMLRTGGHANCPRQLFNPPLKSRRFWYPLKGTGRIEKLFTKLYNVFTKERTL